MPTSLLLLLACSLPPQGPPSTPPPSPIPRVVDVGLELSVDFERHRISGSAAVTLVNTADTSISEISLLLNRLLSVTTVRVGGDAPLAVQQAVVAFGDFAKLRVAQAVITLATPLQPAESLTLHVVYGGAIAPYTETGMLYIQDHVDPEFTILRRDAYAFPLPGIPMIAALRAAPQYDFTYRATITAPSTHTVASGGQLVSRSPAGAMTRWVFTSVGSAPYLVVTIARYRMEDRNGVRLYYFPLDSLGAARVAARTQQALTTLERWFGRLPTPPQFALMEIPDGWGSQASLTGGIIQTEATFRDPDRLTELYHELTHLWNPVDLDTPSARWNEGLATFLMYRLADTLDGRELGAEVHRLLARLQDHISANPTTYSTVPFREYGITRKTDLSYRVGGLMFATLYQLLGSARFDRAYRTLFQTYVASGVTLANLRRTFTDQDAEGHLSQFFSDWLDTTQWVGAVREADSIRNLAGHWSGAAPQ